jgi:hypothetical protein
MRALTDRERADVLLDEVVRLRGELLAARLYAAALTNSTAACLQSGAHGSLDLAPIEPDESGLTTDPPMPDWLRRFLRA